MDKLQLNLWYNSVYSIVTTQKWFCLVNLYYGENNTNKITKETIDSNLAALISFITNQLQIDNFFYIIYTKDDEGGYIYYQMLLNKEIDINQISKKWIDIIAKNKYNNEFFNLNKKEKLVDIINLYTQNSQGDFTVIKNKMYLNIYPLLRKLQQDNIVKVLKKRYNLIKIWSFSENLKSLYKERCSYLYYENMQMNLERQSINIKDFKNLNLDHQFSLIFNKLYRKHKNKFVVDINNHVNKSRIFKKYLSKIMKEDNLFYEKLFAVSLNAFLQLIKSGAFSNKIDLFKKVATDFIISVNTTDQQADNPLKVLINEEKEIINIGCSITKIFSTNLKNIFVYEDLRVNKNNQVFIGLTSDKQFISKIAVSLNDLNQQLEQELEDNIEQEEIDETKIFLEDFLSNTSYVHNKPMYFIPKEWKIKSEYEEDEKNIDSQNATYNYTGGYYLNGMEEITEVKIPLCTINKIKGKHKIYLNKKTVNIINELQNQPYSIDLSLFIKIKEIFLPKIIDEYNKAKKLLRLKSIIDIKKNEAKESKKHFKISKKTFEKISESIENYHIIKMLDKIVDDGIYHFYFPYRIDFRGRYYNLSQYSPISSSLFRVLIRDSKLKQIDEEEFYNYYSREIFDELCSFDKNIEIYKSKSIFKLKDEFELYSENSNLKNFFLILEAEDLREKVMNFSLLYERQRLELHKKIYFKTPYESDIFLSIDATSSGPQILSIIAKDSEFSPLLNLQKSSRSKNPQDIYIYLAKLFFTEKTEICEKIFPKINWNDENSDLYFKKQIRKLFKSILMKGLYGFSLYSFKSEFKTICYNIASHIIFKEKGHLELDIIKLEYKKIEFLKQEVLTEGAESIWEFIHNKVILFELLEYFKNYAEIILSYKEDNGNKSIIWKNPINLKIKQIYNKTIKSKIKIKILNETKYIQYSELSRECNTKKMINSFSANFIHSIDSAIISTIFEKSNKKNIQIFIIHDQIMTNSMHIKQMRKIIQESYSTIFLENKILQSLHNQIEEILNNIEKIKFNKKEKDKILEKIKRNNEIFNKIKNKKDINNFKNYFYIFR